MGVLDDTNDSTVPEPTPPLTREKGIARIREVMAKLIAADTNDNRVIDGKEIQSVIPLLFGFRTINDVCVKKRPGALMTSLFDRAIDAEATAPLKALRHPSENNVRSIGGLIRRGPEGLGEEDTPADAPADPADRKLIVDAARDPSLKRLGELLPRKVEGVTLQTFCAETWDAIKHFKEKEKSFDLKPAPTPPRKDGVLDESVGMRGA